MVLPLLRLYEGGSTKNFQISLYLFLEKAKTSKLVRKSHVDSYIHSQFVSQLLHRDPMPYSAYECHKLKVNENSIEIETGRDLFFDKFQVHPLISIEIILSVT